ncbi:MAG: methylaspartate mutase subunit S [Chloroflexi bacterium]|nr:methylaspartate mutase subunit S [Chloroflexota bacterium]
MGTIGHDVHNIGNVIIQHALTRAGYSVVPLGVAVSHDEFIKAAIETAADAILISSLSGMAEISCRGMREKCIEAGIGDILLYVGGNLVIGKRAWADVETEFKAMGFARVAPPGAKVEQVVQWLAEDLKVGVAGR